MHPSLQGKDKKERRHLEKLEKALRQATVKASPRTGATAPTTTEDLRPSTNMRLARSIRDRKAQPRPSRLGISLGEPSNASPVVGVGTTTTVTHTRKKQPAGPTPMAAAPAPTTTAPAPTAAAPAPPPRPPHSLARPPVQRIVVAVPPAPAPAAVTAARGPSTTTSRRPIRPDTAPVPPTRVLAEASEDTATPGSGSTPAPAPETETPLTGEWMAERVTWSSEIQVQEGRIVHNAASPLRQALWVSAMLDIAAQTGLLPAELLDEADRLFLAVEQCRGTRLRTLRSWHAPYKSQQPGVSAGARRVPPRPSARPAVQASVVQAAEHRVQTVAQPAARHGTLATPAPTTQRELVKPLNALPRRGGEDGVDDEPVLPMLARKCAILQTENGRRAHQFILDRLSRASGLDVVSNPNDISVQAPAVQAAKSPVQPVAQRAARHGGPATPAPTTQRKPLKPLNALPHRGGEDGVDEEPLLPMLARKCAQLQTENGRRAQRFILDRLSRATRLDVASNPTTVSNQPSTRKSRVADATRPRRDP